MKNGHRWRRLLLVVLITLLQLALSCARAGNVLTTHPVGNTALVPGTYTAVLYSTSEYDFLKTIAFLDLEGDAHQIVPHGAQFNYSVVRGLSLDGAEQQAREFVATHVTYNKMELRAIRSVEGKTIGYELRPWHLPITYGESDVLDVTYVQQANGKVTVYVGLKMRIERHLERDRR